MTPRFLACGDQAVTVEFGDGIDPAVNDHVLALDATLNAARIPGVVETVPTYRSLLVQFDAACIDYETLVARIRALAADTRPAALSARHWRVPVVYGGEFGVDLDDVAERHGMQPAEVIERHAAATYRVYMIGFMPGFAYLGGLDPKLATPRRLDPRAMTPPGTISIGGIQALIAAQAMPSGWHLLGRTPVRPFAPERDPPFLFAPGDLVTFAPTDASHWPALERAALAGESVAERIDTP